MSIKNYLLLFLLIGAMSCEDTLDDFDQPSQTETNKSTKQANSGRRLPTDAYYSQGYSFGVSDANWLVDQTFVQGSCIGSGITIEDDGTIDRSSMIITTGSCYITNAQMYSAFSNFVSGYRANLLNRIQSTSNPEKQYYQGILNGFNSRICQLRFTYGYSVGGC
ncbi:hypothetical protein [Fulvivirga sp.]|uniref:hypothetical protein n=1 Tax=Fulvivirga sp. TaxID=1931237 RepID=UPI0032EDC9D1